MDSPQKAPRKTILVAEDTALVLKTVSLILEHANFTVLAASNAGEAIRIAESAKTIDVLLSDVMMPDMSGPDLALRLKELRPNMAVILMSGYDGGGVPLFNHGWHFIQKPFVPVHLVAKIHNVLADDMQDTREKSDLGLPAYLVN